MCDGHFFWGKAIEQNLSKTCLYNSSNLTFQRWVVQLYCCWMSVYDRGLNWIFWSNALLCSTLIVLRTSSREKGFQVYPSCLRINSRLPGLVFACKLVRYFPVFAKIPSPLPPRSLGPTQATLVSLWLRVGKRFSGTKNSCPCHFAAKRAKLYTLIKRVGRVLCTFFNKIFFTSAECTKSCQHTFAIITCFTGETSFIITRHFHTCELSSYL